MIRKKKVQLSSDKKIADLIKKIVSIGVSTTFMTEDSTKKLLKELSLPKQFVAGFVKNAKNAKADISKSLRDEIRKYLSKIDIVKIIEHLTNKYDLKIDATISFQKKNKKKQK